MTDAKVARLRLRRASTAIPFSITVTLNIVEITGTHFENLLLQ